MAGRDQLPQGAKLSMMGSKPRPPAAQRKEKEESEEEEGRSSLGKKSHHKRKRAPETAQAPIPDDAADAIEQKATNEQHDPPPTKVGNYLDEVLADQSHSRKKRKQSKKKRQKLKRKLAAEAPNPIT